MWILDRERYWSFLKAYSICFVALVGLYVVIDAFSNLDEFAEWAESTPNLLYNMGRYYLIKMSLIYDQISGVITMMAAIFTVTWMQKNNELLAMLAAGISTHRVIRPVLASAILISGLGVLNQELIMPRLSVELQRNPDDDGHQKIFVSQHLDGNDVLIDGRAADRSAKSITKLQVTIPVRVAGELLEIQSREAHYIADGDLRYPHSGGWLLWGSRFLTEPTSDSLEQLTRGVLTRVDNPEIYPRPADPIAAKPGVPVYFLKTPISFTAMTRTRQWYHFAPTIDLIRGLSDPSNYPERGEIQVFLHFRLIRPLMGFTLMLLSLPLVLGGTGRNMFVNLGMSLATSGVFYSVNFMSQYLGGHDVLTPELSAWAPLILFGTIAVGRWDTIRT
ncbi:LptF/LptG family permease [Tundrisphaera lichenicola]|uniref:LptF/LptG family permease n=1 Tax=Tundrisphaera lichenicola TaxID=2029860 RepID=UPI003EBAB67A